MSMGFSVPQKLSLFRRCICVRSRLLLVKSDAQTVASGACGGRCVNSGLGGGTWVAWQSGSCEMQVQIVHGKDCHEMLNET